MPLLVASLLRVVFWLRLREIEFFNFYIYQNILQFFLWFQNGVVIVVSLATILRIIHVSNRVWISHVVLWFLLSRTVGRKGYCSAYCLTYSLLKLFLIQGSSFSSLWQPTQMAQTRKIQFIYKTTEVSFISVSSIITLPSGFASW
jgi:hypothetical protein